jgi:hypothetical protein
LKSFAQLETRTLLFIDHHPSRPAAVAESDPDEVRRAELMGANFLVVAE